MDYEQALLEIEKVIFSTMDVKTAMATLVDFCAAQIPSPHWENEKTNAWEGEIDALKVWVEKTLTLDPPDDDVDALYLGVYYPETEDGSARVPVMYLGGTHTYTEEEWADEPSYAPNGMDIDCEMLRHLYVRLSAISEAAQSLGDYVLSLGFVCIAGRELARRIDRALLVGKRESRHLVCGFEGEDYFNLGRMTPGSNELE